MSSFIKELVCEPLCGELRLAGASRQLICRRDKIAICIVTCSLAIATSAVKEEGIDCNFGTKTSFHVIVKFIISSCVSLKTVKIYKQ